MRRDRALELIVSSAPRIQDCGAPHDVAGPTEHFGQAGAQDVDFGEDIDVDKGTNGVVAHDYEVVLVGQSAEPPYIRGA